MSEEKIDLEFQKRSEACGQVEARIKEYVDEYEFDDGESSHMPTELESFLIYDAIHGLLADDEFIAKFTAWKALCVDRQAALQESEAQPVAWVDGDDAQRILAWGDIAAFDIPVGAKLYLAPPSAQAIETAAIMKCVELAENSYVVWSMGLPDGNRALCAAIGRQLRALIPKDGRTQLEEFGMKVADKVYGHFGVDPDREQLRSIVTNLIGAAK